MKVFKYTSGFRKIKTPVITLGNFDGVHLGHQRILKRLAQRAKRLGVSSVVYTFDPHPLSVVAPHKSPPLILDIDDKTRRIAECGTDALVFARFTREFASRHPREFVEKELMPMSVREIWVGLDFSFGKGRAGNVEYLQSLGAELGFEVHVIPAYMKEGSVVSSSRIRELVKAGSVEKATRLLGRRYSIKGTVVRGKDMGRSLGFPTANLRVSSELVPANGVYAAFATIDGQTYRSVLNIGTAPTFGGKACSIEVHIFGFTDDIYGRKMEVAFVRRLRSEKAFSSKEALVARIKKDVERAKKILGGRG